MKNIRVKARLIRAMRRVPQGVRRVGRCRLRSRNNGELKPPRCRHAEPRPDLHRGAGFRFHHRDREHDRRDGDADHRRARSAVSICWAGCSPSYLLTQVVTIPIYGRLSDLYGRKPILLFGVVPVHRRLDLVRLRLEHAVASDFRASRGSGPARSRRSAAPDRRHLPRRRPRADAGLCLGRVHRRGAARSGGRRVSRRAYDLADGVLDQRAARDYCRSDPRLVFKERFQRRPGIDVSGALLLAAGSFVLLYALAQSAVLPVLWFVLLLALAVILLVSFGVYERSVRSRSGR